MVESKENLVGNHEQIYTIRESDENKLGQNSSGCRSTSCKSCRIEQPWKALNNKQSQRDTNKNKIANSQILRSSGRALREREVRVVMCLNGNLVNYDSPLILVEDSQFGMDGNLIRLEKQNFRKLEFQLVKEINSTFILVNLRSKLRIVWHWARIARKSDDCLINSSTSSIESSDERTSAAAGPLTSF